MKHGVGKRQLMVLTLLGILFGGVIITCIGGSNMEFSANSPNPSAVGDPLVDGNVTQVTRNIYFTKYLLAEVIDIFTYKNNGSNSLTKFIFCTDSDYDSKLIFLSASGLAGNSLPVSKSPLLMNGYETYEVDLIEPLSPGSVQKIMIRSIYTNLTGTSGTYSAQDCQFQFNLFPISPYEILSYTCTITMPSSATVNTFLPDPPVKTGTSGTWAINDLTAFSSYPVNISFTYNDAPILQMTTLNRRIVIDPWGYLNVEEDHVLSNMGLLPVNSYSYRVPKNATNFQIWDDLGGIQGSDLSSVINDDGKTKNLTINLNTNRARLLGGNQFKYTTSYRLVFEMQLSSSWNNYFLNIQTFTSQMDFLIISETTQVILLTGVTLNEVTPSPDQLIVEETKIVATYSSSMVSPLHNRIIQVTFQVNGFWMMLRPFIFILLIAIMVSVYVFLRKIVRREVTSAIQERVNIPTKSLQEYVSIYEEKSALLRELDQLNEDVKLKKVAKKEYNKRVSNIMEKKKEAEEDLKPLGKVISEADERFRKSIEKFQFYEAERLSVEDSLKALEARYRRGAIPSRSAYLKLTSDFIKRLEKIQNDIDKLLNEFKSYIY